MALNQSSEQTDLPWLNFFYIVCIKLLGYIIYNKSICFVYELVKSNGVLFLMIDVNCLCNENCNKKKDWLNNYGSFVYLKMVTSEGDKINAKISG